MGIDWNKQVYINPECECIIKICIMGQSKEGLAVISRLNHKTGNTNLIPQLKKIASRIRKRL